MATSPNYGWLEPDNTDLVKNGALAIRTLGNAIDTTMATMTPKSLVDAKGDLIAATANDTPARLAVGNNGETLVADSSTATGLRYTANFAAGKNKVINGDFFINQRAFSSTTTNATFGFDRWSLVSVDGTNTYSSQTFTLGAAPVAGYEGTTFARLVSTGQTLTSALTSLQQKIESVRTFAGQTITVSFWAKASSGTPNVSCWVQQSFGTGGSAAVQIGTTKQAITTSWARYSFVFTVPSISGKTVGTNDSFQILLTTSAGSDRNSYTDSLGIQSATIDFWGVQAEAGSTATAFQTATGTIQGELAACQRYYWRTTSINSSTDNLLPIGFGASTTEVVVAGNFPVRMRTYPTALEWAGLRTYDLTTFVTITTATIYTTTTDCYLLSLNAASGMVQYRPTQIRSTSSLPANSYVGFSAEL